MRLAKLIILCVTINWVAGTPGVTEGLQVEPANFTQRKLSSTQSPIKISSTTNAPLRPITMGVTKQSGRALMARSKRPKAKLTFEDGKKLEEEDDDKDTSWLKDDDETTTQPAPKATTPANEDPSKVTDKPETDLVGLQMRVVPVKGVGAPDLKKKKKKKKQGGRAFGKVGESGSEEETSEQPKVSEGQPESSSENDLTTIRPKQSGRSILGFLKPKSLQAAHASLEHPVTMATLKESKSNFKTPKKKHITIYITVDNAQQEETEAPVTKLKVTEAPKSETEPPPPPPAEKVIPSKIKKKRGRHIVFATTKIPTNDKQKTTSTPLKAEEEEEEEDDEEEEAIITKNKNKNKGRITIFAKPSPDEETTKSPPLKEGSVPDKKKNKKGRIMVFAKAKTTTEEPKESVSE